MAITDVQLPTIGGAAHSWGEQIPRIQFKVAGTIYAMICHGITGNPFRFTVNVDFSSDEGTTWDGATVVSLDFASMAIITGLDVVGILQCQFAREVVIGPGGNPSIFGMFMTHVTDGTPPNNTMIVMYFDTVTLDWHALPSQPPISAPLDEGGLSSLNPNPGMDLAVLPNGDMTLIYSWGVEFLECGTGGKNSAFYRVQYSDYIGGAWGAQTEIPGQAGTYTTFFASQVLLSPSNRLHCFLYDFSTIPAPLADCTFPDVNSKLYHIARGADGVTWNTFQTLAGDAPFQLIYNTFPFGLGIIDAGRVVLPYMTGSSNPGQGLGPGISGMLLNALHGDDSDNPTWSTKLIDATIGGGNVNFVPGYRSGQAQEATSQIGAAGGLLYVYYVATTSVSSPLLFPASGVIRRSVFSGGSWQPFTTYRVLNSALDPQFTTPTGVYFYTPDRALYFAVFGGTSFTQNDLMAHFLGEAAPVHVCWPFTYNISVTGAYPQRTGARV